MASGLWESERQRAALYVERRKRERAALRDAVFRRVNAHAAFAEHAGARRRADEERRREQDIDMSVDGDDDDPLAPDGEDLALDFLGDVDADDMRSLLVEQAATTTTTTSTDDASALPAMAPLSMPSHLLSTAKATSVMTATMTGVAVGVSMGEDAGVSELMDELQIDVQSLAASTATTMTTTSTTVSTTKGRRDSEGDESKTEDSTPPRHVLEKRVQRAGEDATRSPSKLSVKRPLGGALESAWKDVFDPQAAAANEMLTWVTGKNDPEVIKRRESLRGDKKRRVTKRFGTDTLLEQATIRRVAKYHAGEGDSSSSSSDEMKSDSDFSPQEVVEIEDEDEKEGSVSDMEVLDEEVGDDDDAKSRRRKPARRRIRQRPRTKMTIRKVSEKAPSAKRPQRLADTREVKQDKLVVEIEVSKRHDEEEEEGTTVTIEPSKRESQVAPSEVREDLSIKEMRQDEDEGTTMNSKPSKRHSRIVHDEDLEDASLEEQPRVGEEHEEIDLRSESEAEPEPDTIDDGPSRQKESTVSQSVDEVDTRSESTRSDCVVKLKVSSEELEKLREGSNAVEVASTKSDCEVPPKGQHETVFPLSLEQSDLMEDDGYGTDEIDDASAEAAEESDTGTLDLENEEMLTQLDEDSKGSPTSTSSGAANGLLNPVEPQVKMSPQHSTPPSNARALQPDSPELKGAAQVETKTVEFEEVSSDVDFGSGESEDFAGDEVVNLASDDEEAEFGQFFESSRKKEINSATGRPEKEATPVQKIAAEVPTPSSSSSSALAKSIPTKVASSVPPEKGSNGLRKVPNINTTTVAKGKYKQTRHAIRLLDSDMRVTNPEPTVHDPKKNLVERSRFFGDARPPPSGEVSPRTIRPLQLRRTISADNGMATGDRYLKYDRTVIQPRTNRKEEFKNAAKLARERFDKRSNISTSKTLTTASSSQQSSTPVMTFETTSVGTGTGVLQPLGGMMTSDGKFVTPREPQMTIYDATGAISKYDDDAPLSESVHKRPSKFVKDIDEAKRQGMDVRKGKPEELDPRSKIPKKSTKQLELERSATKDRAGDKDVKKDKDVTSPPKSKRAKTGKHTDTSDRPSKYGPSNQSASESKRTKSSKSSSTSGPSHYGPREHDSQRRQDESRRSGGSNKPHSRSLSPPGKSYDRDDRVRNRRGRDDGRRRDHEGRDRNWERDGRDRRHDRSRSPHDTRYRDRRSSSPHSSRSSRDYSYRNRRSRSRSRSPSRSTPAIEHRRSEERSLGGTPHERDPRPVTSYAFAENISESMKEDYKSASEAKQQPRSAVLSSREVTNPGALATFDDDGSDIAASDIEFVDDFDDDMGAEAVFDIRFNLADVKIDRELLERMVYVCNLSPQVDETTLTELFEEFGIAEDQDTGCPAVDVFMCQRSNRPRGDARVTFTSREAVPRAVEKLEARIASDSRLNVRPMDDFTMRVLQVQFDTFRDTWLCSDPNCRTETSYWARSCSKCTRRRTFPPSNVKIRYNDWLCSICFAINATNAERCASCQSSLPPLTFEGGSHSRPHNGRYN